MSGSAAAYDEWHERVAGSGSDGPGLASWHRSALALAPDLGGRRAGLRVERFTGRHHVFLLLPRLHPHTFVKEQFRNPVIAWVLRPLARHVSFRARKPRR